MKKKPNGNPQRGFGLLETLVGLFVLVILIFVGTKAFNNVVANHKKAAQLKTLTDAVANTAERLANLSLSTLTDPNEGYTTWSKPQDAGLGDYVFQFRIIPKPSIAGTVDTTLVGLEVQTGVLENGNFKMDRSFATLFSPNLSTKDGLGALTSSADRGAEATFYASLKQKLADLARVVVPDNHKLLNSYSCYNPSECCGFMQEYFANPSLNPTDGIKEKCFYRCAMAGNVTLNAWDKACNSNFCAVAPWKTSSDCCKAIAAGACPDGSVCASVCLDCVHEDGSHCGTTELNVCETEKEFNELFDCKSLTFCDGSPLPYGDVPGWGDIRSICQTPSCQRLENQCGKETVIQCCDSYWETIAKGETPEAIYEICSQITKKSDCCDIDINRGEFDLKCTTTGMVEATQYKGVWYCGTTPYKSGENIERFCVMYKGCPGTYGGEDKSGTGGCSIWTGPLVSASGEDPYSSSQSTSSSSSSKSGSSTSSSSSSSTPVIKSSGSSSRTPSKRGGSPISGGGGRE